MQLDWRAAVTFMTRDAAWKRKLLVGGVLFFPVPPLGWIMALGFRSLTGPRLVERMQPVLPSRRGNLRLILRRGAIAVIVISAHFSPFLLCYRAFGLRSATDATLHWREIAVFISAVALFPPLFLTTLPALYALFPWLHFSAVEVAVLAVLFIGAFFILPASFMQVGMCGNYAAAFRYRPCERTFCAVDHTRAI